MNKKILAGVLIALVIIVGGIGIYIFSHEHVRQVQIIETKKTKVEKVINATGVVESEEEKAYFSSADGQVTAIYFEQGDIIKKGTSLIQFKTQNPEEICAEFDGVISDVKVRPGETITSGTELLTIQSIEKVCVEAEISKEAFEFVEENQKAQIMTVGHTYDGTVEKISHMAVLDSNGTAMITVKISIDQPDEDIFLGMDASVEIYGTSDAIKLPVEAVNIQKDNSYCYVVWNGRTVKRDVTVGSSQDGYVEITSGLSEGEQVVADLKNCTEDMKVNVKDKIESEASYK